MSAVAKAKIVSSRAGDIETLGPNADESVSLTPTNRWALGLLVHPAGQNATDKIGVARHNGLATSWLRLRTIVAGRAAGCAL